KSVLILQPVMASPYYAHARFSDAATILALQDPGADFPYVRSAWRYARGLARMQQNDAAGAAAELAEIEKIGKTTDFRPFDGWKIPAQEVTQIAAHVLRARMAQAKGDLDGALKELEPAAELQDKLPYMEPPYWYYPVRQTLGAVLALKGEHERAREAFGQSL